MRSWDRLIESKLRISDFFTSKIMNLVNRVECLKNWGIGTNQVVDKWEQNYFDPSYIL